MKEIVKLKKIGNEYLEYNSTSGLILEEFQIRAVKKHFDGCDRLYIITNFSEFNIEECSAKINILELYKNNYLTWETITNPANKLFPSGQMDISKNYYVDNQTGMPTYPIYDEDGNLLPNIIDNWSFYYNSILEPYILNSICQAILNYLN